MPRWFRRQTEGLPEEVSTPPAREIPADMWVRCPKCRELTYTKEFERNLKVCQKCGYHSRLGAFERIAQLCDPGCFVEHDRHLLPADPLGFVAAGVPYPTKLAETQENSRLPEAVVCGRGAIEGLALQLAVMDFNFLGASMGSVVGEKITRAIERAAERLEPLLVVASSGGARMHEGIYSLMQMPKTVAALARLGERRVPYFALLADPTYGGVTASFAALADVILAEPGAEIGFAGRRVIEQVTKEKLPPAAQTAEFMLEHGMIDLVVPRRDLRQTMARLLRFYIAAEGKHGRASPLA